MRGFRALVGGHHLARARGGNLVFACIEFRNLARAANMPIIAHNTPRGSHRDRPAYTDASIGSQPDKRQRGELIAKPQPPLFHGPVQFEFDLDPVRRSPAEGHLTVGNRRIPVTLVRHPRARRYVLRLQPDGCARVTIPRGGSRAEARRFAERKVRWLERTLQRLALRSARPKEWLIGTKIHFRGELIMIEAGTNGDRGHFRFGSETIRVSDPTADLRPLLERHLWRLAAKELPPRVLEYATLHQVPVARVTVRNQRSRWGSSSRRGTISLNWRLIQAPSFVRDYLILHELMHLKEMNHSSRFWRHVERVCPDYRTAERWLKEHSGLLE